MSLKRKAIGGLLWTFGQQFSVQVINFIVQIILARILGPDAFGLVAMIMIVTIVGNTLTDSGLTSSLIRTIDPNEKDYSTVFYTNLIISSLVYVIIFITAPFVAKFYNQDILSSIIRVYSFSIIIRALSSVQNTKLTKEMNFKKQMSIQVPSVVIAGILGVCLAYLDFGVWSLVYMNIVQISIFTLFQWFSSDWKPSFVFDINRFRYHFGFGYKLMLSSLMHNLYTNLYTVLIGKFFSANQVGYYVQADNLRSFPARQVTTAVDKVSYPLFANLQDNNAQLKVAYRRVMQQIIFWLTPLMCYLALVAKPLFYLVLSDKWEQSIVYFKVLSVAAIITPLTVYNLNILNVKGRSDLVFRLSIFKYIISILGVLAIYKFGIIYLVWFQFFITFINFFINSFFSGKMIAYTAFQQIKDVALYYIFGVMLFMLLTLFLPFSFSFLKIDEISWLSVFYQAFIYFGIYFLVAIKMKFKPFFDFLNIVNDFKSKSTS